MMRDNVAHRKRTGSHYTPNGLAQFVANKILEYLESGKPTANITVLDPACGDGELLLSLTEVFPIALRKYLKLIGIDSNSSAFHSARLRLQNLSVHSIDLRMSDFLEHCITELTTSSPIPGSLRDNVDIIIANPPYVRTQILGSEKSQKLALNFNLSGRVDLYHAFLVGMKQCLKVGGIIGVITSNRFISTKSGNAIRELLAQEFEVLELIDLGDTKLFEAAVLPAVLIARRRQSGVFKSAQTSRFTKIYETSVRTKAHNSTSVYEALQNPSCSVVCIKRNQYRITTGTIAVPYSGKDPWVLVSDEEKAWLRQINRTAKYTIADVTKVRVGVKTTADKVFIRQTWEDVPQRLRPEDSQLRPLISASDTKKWYAKSEPQNLKQILYPHYVENGRRSVIRLEDYPGVASYFEHHRKQLEKREYLHKSNRKWYEIWVPQDPDAWRKPKIVFPDISPAPHFLLDTSGALVNGNCYWMVFDQYEALDWLYLIMGIANSQVMTRYHDLSFNNKLYAGRRRYLTQYVERYPLPDIICSSAQSIIEIVKQIVTHHPKRQELSSLEEELEIAVMQAYDTDSIPTG